LREDQYDEASVETRADVALLPLRGFEPRVLESEGGVRGQARAA
jgi:hypothetical protein